MTGRGARQLKAKAMLLIGGAFMASIGGRAQAQQVGGIQLMSDGCTYVPAGSSWLRVGCAFTDGLKVVFRNDREGGLMYVLVAGEGGPSWELLSHYNARMARGGLDTALLPRDVGLQPSGGLGYYPQPSGGLGYSPEPSGDLSAQRADEAFQKEWDSADKAGDESKKRQIEKIEALRQRAKEVWVEPDCNFSYNGCR